MRTPMQNLEERVRATELSIAVIKSEMGKLSQVTQDNTSAVKSLNDTMIKIGESLAVNKGIFIASAKFAGFFTLVIAAAWAVALKVLDILHLGAK